MLKISLCFLMLVALNVGAQPILKENLTKKTYLYWDYNKTKIQAFGAYYKDPLGETTKEHGKWEYFDRYGKLEEVRNYYKGKLNGAVLLKYPNGKDKQEGYFKDDKQDSVYREWNEAGKLEKEGYYLNNVAVGIWKYFYIDGRPKMIEEIVDSTKYVKDFWLYDSLHTQTLVDGTGEIVDYYNNGVLKQWYNYKSGILDGQFLENSIFGDTSLSGAYINGKKTGEWRFFYYTGKIEKIVNYEDDRLEGRYRYFYDNGQVNVEGYNKKGMKNGVWTWYTKFGVRDMSGTFREDLQDGDWTYWFPTGELSYTAQYKSGLKHGNWNYLYKEGTKFKKGSFANDQKDGLWETWYEDGTLLMTGKYVAGKEEGKWINYWENGKVKNEATFKGGVLDGEWKSFSHTGTVKVTGYYKGGLKTKQWNDYFDNGRLKDVSSYKVVKIKSKVKYGPMKGKTRLESVKEGHFESYSSKDFKKTEEGDYKKGEKHGQWTAYYPGAKIPAVVSTYKNGKLDGPMREYGRRGEIISEVNYKDGMKHGYLRTFDKKGKVLTEKEYENGSIKGQGGFSPGGR